MASRRVPSPAGAAPSGLPGAAVASPAAGGVALEAQALLRGSSWWHLLTPTPLPRQRLRTSLPPTVISEVWPSPSSTRPRAWGLEPRSVSVFKGNVGSPPLLAPPSTGCHSCGRGPLLEACARSSYVLAWGCPPAICSQLRCEDSKPVGQGGVAFGLPSSFLEGGLSRATR